MKISKTSLHNWTMPILLLGLVACGGDDGGGGGGGSKPTPTNRAPTISGSPLLTATVGQAYSFTPQASDADGDTLSFMVTNSPTWANFDASNGHLSGTPQAGNVGTNPNVLISVSDGTATTNLSGFSITVLTNVNTQDTDNDGLTELASISTVNHLVTTI